MEPEHPVLVRKQPSECLPVTDFVLVGLRMLRLFPTTGLVDLVVDAVDESNLSGSFLPCPTLLRYGS